MSDPTLPVESLNGQPGKPSFPPGSSSDEKSIPADPLVRSLSYRRPEIFHIRSHEIRCEIVDSELKLDHKDKERDHDPHSNAMNIKLTCGSELLIAEWPGEIPPTVDQLLAAARTTRPEVVATWCDDQGTLRASLPVLVNGEHIRYRKGLQTELKDGDDVYVIPLIAGG